MAGDEYSTAIGGGKLKLKGSKVKDGRVDKKKKKEKEKKTSGGESSDIAQNDGQMANTENRESDAASGEHEEKRVFHKTEAEKRYEEQRKKKLNDRLRREGVKTHKERVEDLNRYLSTLSEHHDMPKIGPG